MSSNASSPWRIEWSDELSVALPEIDAEHRHFIDLVNQFNEAILWRMDIEQVRAHLAEIIADAQKHFSHEEQLFSEWGYPDAPNHAAKHLSILNALESTMARFMFTDSTEYEWIDAGLKIKHLLVEHLLAEDMKYRDYHLAHVVHSGTAKGSSSRPQ